MPSIAVLLPFHIYNL